MRCPFQKLMSFTSSARSAVAKYSNSKSNIDKVVDMKPRVAPTLFVILLTLCGLPAQSKELTPAEVLKAYNTNLEYATRLRDLWPYTDKSVVEEQKKLEPAKRREELLKLKGFYVINLKISKEVIKADIAMISYEGIGEDDKKQQFNAAGTAKLVKNNGHWKVFKFFVSQ